MLTKGQRTRSAILERATGLASQLGLTGLTIGHLADELRLSKSGLFAHFRSKEALQIQVLEHAAAKFVEQVVRPALGEPRGEPRLRALFERWLAWDTAQALPGGCVFAQAASELDDRAGPVRDRLVALQRDWIGVLVTSVGLGAAAGRFRPDADAEQFAQDLYGVMLAFHHAWRLLGDPQAEARARRAFGALLDGISRTSDTEERP
jgi:AcrR family transcriptional regulator